MNDFGVHARENLAPVHFTRLPANQTQTRLQILESTANLSFQHPIVPTATTTFKMPRKTKNEDVPDQSEEELEEELGEDEPPAIEPYTVLGLERSATEDEIKSAYRKAALKHHPGMSTHTTIISGHF